MFTGLEFDTATNDEILRSSKQITTESETGFKVQDDRLIACPINYSWRSASIGSSFAADWAG